MIGGATSGGRCCAVCMVRGLTRHFALFSTAIGRSCAGSSGGSHRVPGPSSSGRRMTTGSSSSSGDLYGPADRLKGFEAPTVWEEFTPLAREHGAVNLGQGFPDWPTPTFVKAAAARAVEDNFNQYCRSGGLPELVNALAKHYSPIYGRTLDPMKEVTVSVGVSEGIFAAIQSVVNPGDEVLLLEPAFDIYSAQVKMAGGKCVYVPIRPPDETSPTWHLCFDEFKAAFTDKTRMLILNTPQNPTGKVFKEHELLTITKILEEFPRVIVLADEVYENLVYEGEKHIKIATLPGMWERTISLCSAGKTFSVTGWKIGWLVGHEKLIHGVMIANQWVQFSVATCLQKAVAEVLEEANKPHEGHESYYAWLTEQYKRKRDLLVAALTSAGLKPIMPEGGFFIVADTSAAKVPDKFLQETTRAAPVMYRDWAFCRWLTTEVGVAAIPPSAFYCDEHKSMAGNYARFAFCKTDESIIEAHARFDKHFKGGSTGN